MKRNNRSIVNRSSLKEAHRQRFRSFLIEPLESRILLAADLTYPDSLVRDFTLVADNSVSPPHLNLLNTITLATVASVALDDAGDVTVNVKRNSIGDVAGDTLRIKLDTLGLLNSYVTSSGGLLTINFDGGLEVPVISDDQVRLEGSGSYAVGFSLTVLATSDVVLSASTVTLTGILLSIPKMRCRWPAVRSRQPISLLLQT